MKGKFLDTAAKKYNSTYEKMKKGGTTKKKTGGCVKCNKNK